MEILLDNVLPAIVSIFFIISLGYLIGRKTNYDLSFATDATVYFTFPTLIFSALAHKWDTPFLAREFLVTGVGAIVITVGTGLLVAVYLTITKQKHLTILYPTVMFINAGNLALSFSSAGTKIANRLNLRTPVIATVINHPASLGVKGDSGSSDTQSAGPSYYVDAEKQLQLYRALFPDTDRIGMIYDRNNPSGALAEEPFMESAATENELEFASIPVTEKTEVAKAAKSLVDTGVDVIVIPTNRLVYANLDLVLDVTTPAQVPVVSMNKQGVENGALAGLFADTYDLGRQTAEMAREILLHGIEPTALDFAYIPEPGIILNMTSAANLNYEFPAEILGNAAIVMD